MNKLKAVRKKYKMRRKGKKERRREKDSTAHLRRMSRIMRKYHDENKLLELADDALITEYLERENELKPLDKILDTFWDNMQEDGDKGYE